MEGNFDKQYREPEYSKKLKAGRRRTYFFDVRSTRAKDYYITITESKKVDEFKYERHKIFIYKEDFNKFQEYFGEVINEVKTKYLPDFDFDSYDYESNYNPENNYSPMEDSDDSE